MSSCFTYLQKSFSRMNALPWYKQNNWSFVVNGRTFAVHTASGGWTAATREFKKQAEAAGITRNERGRHVEAYLLD